MSAPFFVRYTTPDTHGSDPFNRFWRPNDLIDVGKLCHRKDEVGAPSAPAGDERYVQKQLGHASAEMRRRYQRRRERFRVNLTTAAGL